MAVENEKMFLASNKNSKQYMLWMCCISKGKNQCIGWNATEQVITTCEIRRQIDAKAYFILCNRLFHGYFLITPYSTYV